LARYITTAYAGGFPVGYLEHHTAFLFNHVNIIVEYHPLDDGSRVVGFYVEVRGPSHLTVARWDPNHILTRWARTNDRGGGERWEERETNVRLARRRRDEAAMGAR